MNKILQVLLSGPPRAPARFRFTIQGMMVTTTIAALSFAALRSLTPQPQYLAVIYVAGPILLVLGAFLPRGLTWQQRVKLILPLIAGL
ncbi:MAG: hypothetical protein AAFP69_21560, partial [Planctomycetota bacterium]